MTPPQAVAAQTEKEVTLPRAREEPGRFSRLPSADHLLDTQLRVRGEGYSRKEPAILGRRRARGRAQTLHIRFRSPAGAGRGGGGLITCLTPHPQQLEAVLFTHSTYGPAPLYPQPLQNLSLMRTGP